MFEIDYTGIGQTLAVTFKYAGLTRGEDEGKPVKITANDTVALADDGDPFAGIVITIEDDVCAVLLDGVVTAKVGSDAPSPGHQKLTAGPKGSINNNETDGREYLVLRVDNGRVTFLL